MAGFYFPFVANRATEADFVLLVAQLRQAIDPTVGIQHDVGTQFYRLKKSTDWTGPQIATAQGVLDAAAIITIQGQGQQQVDNFPIALRALVLALVDQLNVIRAALPIPLPPITPLQALNAIRAKAGTL